MDGKVFNVGNFVFEVIEENGIRYMECRSVSGNWCSILRGDSFVFAHLNALLFEDKDISDDVKKRFAEGMAMCQFITATELLDYDFIMEFLDAYEHLQMRNLKRYGTLDEESDTGFIAKEKEFYENVVEPMKDALSDDTDDDLDIDEETE